ncbi:SDR family oxidoreductase [Horticoccus luteus]|uniref:SDR family oxidoreductase n=1 Tax=Horticoccus luteus TaxID=2862869 RepID=A0A8F9XL09_9BACT|nr:SDR family oxidoreductase [Horticoccus luteus]QYM78731.1 SDR family oxidoreductase [Horticoccus luteus]
MSASSFAGQHAIVTGGGTGIGRALALALAARGATVLIVARNATHLAEVASHRPDLIRTAACDLHDATRWTELIRAQPRLDLLINNAALSVPTDLANPADTSLAEVMAVNFGAAWTGSREAAQHMRAAGGGRIVNITSVHSRLAERGSTAYGVGKAALEQLTRCLAVEWAPHGILVNAVAPGFVDTPMSRATGINELETDWFRQNYLASGRIPLRRAAQPDEMVAPVLFLASKENTYVTGQTIIADGGLSLTL